jgi:rare lipoprotein A
VGNAIPRAGAALSLCVLLLAVAGTAEAQVNDPAGRKPQPADFGADNEGPPIEVGIGSWYGGRLVRGHRTANGDRFDEAKLTAAHPKLPFSTWVRVTNLGNGKDVTVRINDRNATYTGRVIDLSRRAAEVLDMKRQGVGLVAIVPAQGAAPQVISSPARHPGVPSS